MHVYYMLSVCGQCTGFRIGWVSSYNGEWGQISLGTVSAKFLRFMWLLVVSRLPSSQSYVLFLFLELVEQVSSSLFLRVTLLFHKLSSNFTGNTCYFKSSVQGFVFVFDIWTITHETCYVSDLLTVMSTLWPI